MGRLFVVAVLWAAALVPLSSHAQMRGGTIRGPVVGPRVSPGARPAAPGPFMGARPVAPPVMGARPVGPPGGRVFMGRPVAPRGRVFANQPLAPAGQFPRRTFDSSGRVIFVTNPFAFNNCGGLPCTNPFFFSGHFFNGPFFPGSFFPGFFPGASGFFPGAFWGASYIPGFSDYYYPPQQQPQQPVVVTTDNTNDVQLAVQMQRLTDEIEQLKEEQVRERMARQAPGAPMSAAAPAALTIFVFRDGRRVTAQNYAIAGETLWIFSEHTAKRLSLADLDRAATEQVNAANGVAVHLPEVRSR